MNLGLVWSRASVLSQHWSCASTAQATEHELSFGKVGAAYLEPHLQVSCKQPWLSRNLRSEEVARTCA